MDKPNKAHIFFTPHEVMAIGMGLGLTMETLNQNREQPWNPEARKSQKEILAAVKSAAAKLEKHTGFKCDLPPYIAGDENDFLTKES